MPIVIVTEKRDSKVTVPWQSKASFFCLMSIHATGASSPAYTGITPRMERVWCLHKSPASPARVQPLLVTTVPVHLLSDDSDPFQISAAIHGFSTCLSGASQGDYERDKVQREGKMPVTQAPQKHFCPPGGHRSNVLILQVQQPGHSNFLLLPRVLAGKYK